MNSSEIVVRRAHTADAKQMVQVHYDAVHGISGPYSQALLDSWSPSPNLRRVEWMRGVIDSDTRVAFIAELQNTVCGFSICLPDDGLIYALYVHPNFAKCGIGRILLEHTENHLIQTGITCSSLNASVNAVQFYKSLGYEVIGPATQTLADGSEMDCYEMQKGLLPD